MKNKTGVRRGPGRPPSPDRAAETFQFRTTSEQRAPWAQSAHDNGQTESEWARDALNAWVHVCTRAAELGTNPQALLEAALDDNARIRAAIVELEHARSLSTTEDRVLRVLSPAAWARRQNLEG
jgi:hypothetical protein